ncbi:MAG: SpoIIIAH-like family protein [Firmicutes bacterium]|nr:SpoIIIAH-like family protein [Bacillota bacterium]MCL2256341.1 SpoIIIAH-like family protein [Bacillota bacterium]
MKSMKKSFQIILSLTALVSVLFLMTGCFVFDWIGGDSDTSNHNNPNRHFFEILRNERTASRNTAVVHWQSVIDNTYCEETIEKATREKEAILDVLMIEITIETLLIANDFEDAHVLMCSNWVRVFIKADKITEYESYLILEIVLRQIENSDIHFCESQIILFPLNQ